MCGTSTTSLTSIFGDHFAGRHKIIIGMLEYFVRQMLHKIKYAGIFPLMLAECFVIHKQIYDIAAAVDLIDPVGEFFRRQRPFGPAAV